MILTGLKVDSFANPEDRKAYQVIAGLKLDALINWLSTTQTRLLLKAQLLSDYYGISPQSNAHLWSIITDVCRTMDYTPVPQIFTHRSSLFDYKIYIGENPAVILSDYAINEFDDDMLRFHIGCAITALKANTHQLRMATMFAMPLVQQIPIVGNILPLPLASWARKSVLTEVRGGLLACQNFDAAARVLVRMTGLPISEMDGQRLPDIVEAYKPSSVLSNVAHNLMTVSRLQPWANDELVELFTWYSSGAYDDILDEYR